MATKTIDETSTGTGTAKARDAARPASRTGGAAVSVEGRKGSYVRPEVLLSCQRRAMLDLLEPSRSR